MPTRARSALAISGHRLNELRGGEPLKRRVRHIHKFICATEGNTKSKTVLQNLQRLLTFHGYGIELIHIDHKPHSTDRERRTRVPINWNR